MYKRKAINAKQKTGQNKRDKTEIAETDRANEMRKKMNELSKAFKSPEAYLIGT